MQSPHDRLFRFLASHPEDARGVLAELLPASVRERIDWTTLRQVPGTFVGAELALRHTDALFVADIDGRATFLYLLLEHQSEPDPWMPLRILGYVVKVLEAHLKAHPKANRVPPVVPLVIHHGEQGWTTARHFHEVLDATPETLSALAPYLPQFELLIDDLATVPEEVLRRRPLTDAAVLMLLLLQRARSSPDIVAELGRWVTHLERVANAPHGVAALIAMLSYAMDVTKTVPTDFLELTRQLGPKAEEALMTGAEMLRKEGEARGKSE